MKNWKRFIAACLSVTMIVSMPLTAFAESPVSVQRLVPEQQETDVAEETTPEETEFEKILSQEKPYEYFSKQEHQQSILDALKDEELFQLKEYLKYAYIYESDLENRQSLDADAYLLISESWRKRNVYYNEEQQKQLLDFLKETPIYDTKFKSENTEKTVQDFPSYMEYLQSIKKFDVPKYVELLSAFDEVKTEEDLANAKDSFEHFEEEIFGFDEQEKITGEESESEGSAALEENSVEKSKQEEEKSEDSKKEETEKTDKENDSKTEEKSDEAVDIDEDDVEDITGTFEMPEGFSLVNPISTYDYVNMGDQNNLQLSVGDKIYWDDYYTHFFTVGGQVAYCLDPAYKFPQSGTYKYSEVKNYNDSLTKILYYTYAGPGYNSSIGPSADWSVQYSYAHFAAGYVYNGQPGYSWSGFNGLSYSAQKEIIAYVNKILALPNPPSDYRAIVFKGQNSNFQGQNVQRIGVLARETAHTYSFHANGGSGAPGSMTKIRGVDFTFPTQVPTRPGYTFTGWNNTTINNGTKYSPGQTVGGLPDRDITWWANWTPNMYGFDVNAILDGKLTGWADGYLTFDVYINGSLVANDVSDYARHHAYGTKYEIKDIKTMSGKKYLGVTQGSLSGTINSDTTVVLKAASMYEFDVNVVLDGTLYSSTNDALTYDVYINGSLAGNDVSDFYNKYPKGTTYQIKDIKAKSGKRYTGVGMGSLSGTINGKTRVDLNAVSIYYLDVNAVLNNQEVSSMDGSWFTFDVYINGSLYSNDVGDFCTEFPTGTKYEIKDIKPKAGKKYLGTTYNTASSGTIGKARTAVWLKFVSTHTITLQAPRLHAGTTWKWDIGTKTYTMDYGSKFNIQNYTNVFTAPTGYHYGGASTDDWWETANHDGTYKNNPSNGGSSTFVVTNNMTAQLHYYPNSYTVKYNGNGSTGGSTAASSHSYDTAKTLTANGYTKTGYTFKNWNTKADGTGTAYTNKQSVKNLTATNGATITLYAQWTPTTYTNKIWHRMHGVKGDDGQSLLLGITDFTANYNTTYKMDASKATKIPNGYALSNTFRYNNNGTYEDYTLGKTMTQKIGSMSYVYMYDAINYKITYNLNEGTNNSGNPSKYNVLNGVTLKDPTRKGYTFEGWYLGDKKITGINEGKNAKFSSVDEMYAELAKRTTGDVTLTAKWTPFTYKITYKGNGSTDGMEKTHTFTQKDIDTNGYVLKINKGYTDFARTKHTFMGWYQGSVVNTKADMTKIYKEGNKLTDSQLLAIHAEQVKKGLVQDTDPKVKNIILYAIWDEAPGISIDQSKKDKFFEGVDVTRAELLSGITASDKIDGNLTDQIIITQIDYSAGKLVNGKKQAAYSQTWENGMPADAKLDTWFMQLDKNDSPVTHTITYQVKDSAGNVTTAKKTVQVIYNEFPTIKANDFKFTLNEAQNGKITKDALLEKAIASGVLSASDVEDGDMKSKIELIDYDANAFKTMKQEGFIPITYRVQDSMGPGGKGKVTLKTVNVNVSILQKKETVRYVRFINKAYYEKNANLDRNALEGKYDQIALLSANGGLHPFSVWYTDPKYREAITGYLEKTTGTTYVYTKEDIKQMRKFVKQHGVGNAKEQNGLSKFADIFMTGDYILK